MSETVTLTRPVFEKIVEQLVYIEENMNEIIELHSPVTEDERESLKAYLLSYVGKMEEVLEKIRVVPNIFKRDTGPEPIENINRFPFAIIGSTVVLEDSDTKEKVRYRIAFPYENSTAYDISFLSGTAKALLLKETGRSVCINTREGEKKYRILSISLNQIF